MLRLSTIWLMFITVRKGSITPSVSSWTPRWKVVLTYFGAFFRPLDFSFFCCRWILSFCSIFFSNRLLVLYFPRVEHVGGFPSNEGTFFHCFGVLFLNEVINSINQLVCTLRYEAFLKDAKTSRDLRPLHRIWRWIQSSDGWCWKKLLSRFASPSRGVGHGRLVVDGSTPEVTKSASHAVAERLILDPTISTNKWCSKVPSYKDFENIRFFSGSNSRRISR